MQLLQNFKDLTLHPKNAKELKGLILQLAIQGKLTANWRKDNLDVEPATELLKQIKNEKELLIKNKKIRNEKPFPLIKKEDLKKEIPASWEFDYIRNISSVVTCGIASTPTYTETGRIFLSAKNVKPFTFKPEKHSYVSEETYQKIIKNSKPEKGDVLLTRVGAGIGEACVIDQDIDFAFYVSLTLIKPMKGIDSHYMLYWLSSKDGIAKVLDNIYGKGVSQGNLNVNQVRQFIMPIPPLEEQKEIVRVVEILFKEVEQLEQLTKERIALKKDFVTSVLRQLTTEDTATEWNYLQNHFKSFFTEKSAVKKLREAVLQLAVQGKLTVDWRKNNLNTEPARELLKRIQKEKAQLIKDKKIKKESPLPPISDDEVPYELPESWIWCRLNNVCEYIQRGKSPTYTEEPKIPVISQKCVQWSGFDITRARFITEKSLEKYGDERFLRKGDLLWNSTGDGTIGRVISYPGSIYEKAVADSHVTVVRGFKNYIDTDYLWIFTASPLIQSLVARRVSGSTKQTELATGTVKLMEFSFPPVEEQKAIVEKVNALMILCDQLEEEIEESKNLNEQLMKSFLREVFETEKVN